MTKSIYYPHLVIALGEFAHEAHKNSVRQKTPDFIEKMVFDAEQGRSSKIYMTCPTQTDDDGVNWYFDVIVVVRSNLEAYVAEAIIRQA